MSGTGRGTGRGRGRRKPEDMPQPDKAAMEKLKQERGTYLTRFYASNVFRDACF